MTTGTVPKSRLGEFAQPVRGEIIIDPTGVYRTIGCHLYGRGIYERETKTGVEIKASRMFSIEKDDLVINRIWAQKGSAGIVPEILGGAVVTQDFPVWKLNPEKAVPSYIGWYLKTPDFWEECRRHSHGTSGRERLSPKELPNVMFPLPPLDEQHRIVARIEELAALIEEAQGLRVKAREEAEALLPTALARVFTQADEERWPRKELNQVATVNMGQSPPGDTYNQEGEGLPLLNGPTEFGTKHPEPVQWTSSPTKICNPGDILICVRGATTGRMNWADQVYCIGRGLAALTPDQSQCLPEYVYYFLQHQTRIILDEARGSTFPNLPGGKLRAFPIPVPLFDEQRHIVAYLDHLQAQVDELTALQDTTQAELDALLPSVLDRAFRGEL